MSKLPTVSGAECVKALEKIGFAVQRQRGRHITMVCQKSVIQVTVPNHTTVAKEYIKSNYQASWFDGR